MDKQRALNLYKAMKEQNFSHSQIVNVCNKIKEQYNIDVFYLIKKNMNPNKYNICELGGHSGGGRLGMIQKSIYRQG